MDRKLNLRTFNVLLALAFVGVFVLVLIVDFVRFQAENTGGILVFWRLDQNVVKWVDDGPAKLVATITSCVAAVAFFIMGRRYNTIRKQKQDKQLATQIYLSLVYLGTARLFEAFFIISDSGLRGLVFSVGKFYIVLDMLGVIMFVLVASEVFLQTDFPADSRFPIFLRRFLFVCIAIALCALFLEYAPPGIATILDWSVVGASIIVLLIIGIVLIVICVKILRLYIRFTENENRGAILVIGIQLVMFIVAMFLLIYLEIGAGDAADYFLRASRCGLLLVVAMLYFPAFINPSRRSS